MKLLLTVLLFAILSSCKQGNGTKKNECVNLTGINNSLYNVLLSYQIKNPIPLVSKYDTNLPPPPQTAFRYIYEVQFKKEQDTLIIISLKPDGIKSVQENFDNRIYGIYEDSCLKPTYFICDSNLSKNFIKNFKRNNLHDFHYDKSSIIDFFYIQYVYKISEGNLVFMTKIQGSIGE